MLLFLHLPTDAFMFYLYDISKHRTYESNSLTLKISYAKV
jgi:hypothetical protein